MDTLECPVCLDTADTPPVYQCPEGHLICKGDLITLNPMTSTLSSCLQTAMGRWWSVPSVATLS